MHEALTRLEPRAARLMGLAFGERLAVIAEHSTEASIDTKVLKAALDLCWGDLSGGPQAGYVSDIEESLKEALPLAANGTVLARSGAALEFYALRAPSSCWPPRRGPDLRKQWRLSCIVG